MSLYLVRRGARSIVVIVRGFRDGNRAWSGPSPHASGVLEPLAASKGCFEYSIPSQRRRQLRSRIERWGYIRLVIKEYGRLSLEKKG